MMMRKRTCSSSLTCISSPKRRKASPTGKGCKVDRISQLPEPILHHIMSFLTTEVDYTKSEIWNPATSRSVSKTWNAAWNSFPVLEFDQSKFEYLCNYQRKDSRTSPKKKAVNFFNFVQETIRSHQSDVSLQKFKLVVNLEGAGRFAIRVQDIHRWLNYARTKNVRSLSFVCSKVHRKLKDQWRYELPESLFRSKSLEELDLDECKFLEDGTKTSSFKFSLKKLSLQHVRVDQVSLQTFLANCCSLEEVSIKHCSGFETVKLAGLKLKEVDVYLNIYPTQTITIEAPNLERVYYGGMWDSGRSSILNWKGPIYENVKELMVHNSRIESEVFFRMVPFKFPSVEKVVLGYNTIESGAIKFPDKLPPKFELVINEEYR